MAQVSMIVRMDRWFSIASNSNQRFFSDEKDIVFYEVALSKENALLVTGNIKLFPKSPMVITPAELLELVNLL